MKKILSIFAAAAMLFAAGSFMACSDGGGGGSNYVPDGKDPDDPKNPGNLGGNGEEGEVEVKGSVNFTSKGSWNEYLYATWTPVSGADGYNVYYSDDNESWEKIDSELVRNGWTERKITNYGLAYTDVPNTDWRADIVGLKYDTKYWVKVVPTKSGAEESDSASVFSASTKKFVRDGYAFFNRTTTGAYNEDGTLKDGADVWYVTEATKNDFVAKLDDLANRSKDNNHCKTPTSIRFIGTVTLPTASSSKSRLDTSKTFFLIKGSDNITIEGIGSDALMYGWGITVKKAENIEIRNMAFNMQKEDALSFEDTVVGLWIHNNDIYIGANMGGDKKKGDGGCDVKANSTNVTISYNHFISTGKSSLCGMSDDSDATKIYMTYSHNWFDKCGSRCPRIRRYQIHVVNNYFDHNYSAGLAVALGASAFVQNNYFEDVNQPVISASQGHSVKTDGSDFCSGENGGVVKMYGNIMAECGDSNFKYLDGDLTVKTNHYKCTDRFTGARELTEAMKTPSSKGFYPSAPDAYMANSRDEKVPDTFYALGGGAKYTNFDTDPSKMYSDSDMHLLEAKDVKKDCVENAGRMGHGGAVSVAELNDSQRVAMTVKALKDLLNGLYYEDLVEEIEVEDEEGNKTTMTRLASIEKGAAVGAVVSSTTSGTTVSFTVTSGTESNNSVSVSAIPDATKVARVVELVRNAVAGIEYTETATTKSAVETAVNAIDVSSVKATGTAISVEESSGVITVKVTCGSASDSTVRLNPPTAESKIAAEKALVLAAIDDIEYTTEKGADAVLAEVNAELGKITNAYTASATAAQDANRDIVITITSTLDSTKSDTVKIARPTNAQYVAAAKSAVEANPAVKWDTDAATTKAAVEAADFSTIKSKYFVNTAVAESDGKVIVTITSTDDSSTTATISLSAFLGFTVTFDNFKTGDVDFNGVTVNITGSLQSGAPERIYDGVTYTKAYKMQSGTISFTAPEAATMTLVATASKEIKINGTAVSTGTAGVITQTLVAGTKYTLEKGTTNTNLYAIIVK